jgi:hypothetical protein
MYKDQIEEDEVCEIHYFLSLSPPFGEKEPTMWGLAQRGSNVWELGTPSL